VFWNGDLAPFLGIVQERWHAIVQECDRVIETTPLWRETEIYEGIWRLFVFYDYETGGTEAVPRNLARCPETRKLLEAIPGRRAASFSALGPRSRIKPHVGLDHGLLRFHCGLRIPSACTLSAMSDYAGLEVANVQSFAGLLAAMEQLRLPQSCLWRYLPSSSAHEQMTAAMILEGIRLLIDDAMFICHAPAVLCAVNEHDHTAFWAALLESEGILKRTDDAAPAISITYPSQAELVRWFNTAIVTEILFPGIFNKSLEFPRRRLVEREACVFNDAFLHEARNDSDELRIVLLVDFERDLTSRRATVP
jgi:Aspartyl/Asparaginyl beta-hydroxylase